MGNCQDFEDLAEDAKTLAYAVQPLLEEIDAISVRAFELHVCLLRLIKVAMKDKNFLLMQSMICRLSTTWTR